MKRLFERCVIALAIVVVGASTWSALSSGPAISVTLEYAGSAMPTVISASDSTGLFKVEQIGTNSYRVVNFDSSIQLGLVQDTALSADALEIEITEDTDPIGLSISWTNATSTWTDEIDALGETTSCADCTSVAIDVN